LVGNLGQDDIIGGSSQFFGLTTAAQRPDAGDIIFGGAANPDRVKRLAFTGDVAGDQITFGAGLANRHAVDSDFIMGDNANIFRIVTDNAGSTAFVQFNYDKTSAFENRGSVRIVVRAYQFLDYSPIESNTTSIGARAIIHGESGDDVMHGGEENDGMLGGEALPQFYNAPELTPRVEVGDLPEDKNGNNEIRIIPRDGNGVIRVGFYDYVNALPKLSNHFLNFENDLA